MAADAALPGLFFTFSAMVLLIFASVSAPTWNSISFLDTTVGGVSTHFGVFGYTGSKAHVGWYFPTGVADSELNDTLFHNLTAALILVPIAAGLAGIAVLFGLCGAAYHRVGTIFMTLVTGLTFFVTLVVWIIAMALFGIARDHVRDRAGAAQYGNANWLVLAALVALFIGFFVSCCGVFGRYRSRRAAY
ncbi:uncharacterized protein FIBRA_02454 [Fibroporia radiculosa]|uniref:Pali-domain-containing protein n=1 Tax=Fibroporia radiculosa TaxID=599839 RepID=J4H1V3_9APHY|nr:uncharacterized protein FIBRA_02454 [Fibroporia radiculosa]CCM00424.1 predicted protein [Fibroporia radiculosa]